jgi:hypothetical protein
MSYYVGEGLKKKISFLRPPTNIDASKLITHKLSQFGFQRQNSNAPQANPLQAIQALMSVAAKTP